MVLNLQWAAGLWQKCCVTTEFPGKLVGLGRDRDMLAPLSRQGMLCRDRVWPGTGAPRSRHSWLTPGRDRNFGVATGPWDNWAGFGSRPEFLGRDRGT